MSCGYKGSMGRSKRTPVIAAGGIVVRRSSKAAIAIVQRKRDNAWVLPKGKIKPKEKLILAAKREVIEETGCVVHVHEFLGVISYLSGGGPKKFVYVYDATSLLNNLAFGSEYQ